MKFLQDPIERLLYLSLVVLFIAGGIGITIIAVELHDAANTAKQVKQVAQEEKDHLDCVALLLTQPNRANLRITDLNNCRIGP